MPKEDILVEGDYVNELFVVVAGEVQVMRSALEEPAESLAIQDDGYTSVHSGGAFHSLRWSNYSCSKAVLAMCSGRLVQLRIDGPQDAFTFVFERLGSSRLCPQQVARLHNAARQGASQHLALIHSSSSTGAR